MPKPHIVVSPEVVIEFIRMKAPEMIGEADVTTEFAAMDVDSLSLVEIAVMISEKHQISVEDWEIAETGNFQRLADLINIRVNGVEVS